MIPWNYSAYVDPALELGELTTLGTIVSLIVVTFIIIVTLSCVFSSPLRTQSTLPWRVSGLVASAHSLQVLLDPISLDDVLLGPESA